MLREVFFHGKEEYDYFEANLNKVLNDNISVKKLFRNGKVPSYEYYENWFIINYHPDKTHLLSDAFFEQSRDDLKLVPQSYDMCPNHQLDYHKHDASIHYVNRLLMVINDSTPVCMPYLGLSLNRLSEMSLMRFILLNNCIAKKFK